MTQLCRALRERVHNGELTERGFARKVGLSQSHVHNVLSGSRVLTIRTADRILSGLGITVADLFDPDDLRRHGGTAEGGTLPD